MCIYIYIYIHTHTHTYILGLGKKYRYLDINRLLFLRNDIDSFKSQESISLACFQLIGCLHMTSLLWREMQLEGRKRFLKESVAETQNACVLRYLWMLKSVKPSKHKALLSCTKVLFIKEEKSRNWRLKIGLNENGLNEKSITYLVKISQW